jgi:hypothetical protein
MAAILNKKRSIFFLARFMASVIKTFLIASRFSMKM